MKYKLILAEKEVNQVRDEIEAKMKDIFPSRLIEEDECEYPHIQVLHNAVIVELSPGEGVNFNDIQNAGEYLEIDLGGIDIESDIALSNITGPRSQIFITFNF